MFDILGYLDDAFLEPWRVAIVSIQAGGDSATAGFILVGILIVLWIFMFWMIKLVVLDVVFPRIRLIDRFNNRVRTARIIARSKPPVLRQEHLLSAFGKKDDVPEDKFYWVKFSLFPLIHFYRVKIDAKYRLRRMPWHLDVFTEGLNLCWNNDEQAYCIEEEGVLTIEEDKTSYVNHAMSDILLIGDKVVEGVKGDYGLIKDKFKLGLSIKKIRPDVELKSLEEREQILKAERDAK